MMETFQANINLIKQKLMKTFINQTDSQYYLLKIKPTHNQYQSRYLQIYQNVYLMQFMSLLGLIPPLIYFVKMKKLMKIPGFSVQQQSRLSKRLVLYLGLATSITITSSIYQYKNDFKAITKQIQNSHRKQIQKGNLIAIDLTK